MCSLNVNQVKRPLKKAPIPFSITLGNCIGLFYILCNEISDLDWAVALHQLIELLEYTLKESNKKIQKLIKGQLQQWIAGLPNYIKAYLPISVCESWS
jgi:hypothetical protein